MYQGHGDTAVPLKAWKLMLVQRSPYFAILFKDDYWAESRSLMITREDNSVDAVRRVLTYIHTGHMELPSVLSGSNDPIDLSFEVLSIVDEWRLGSEIIEWVEAYICTAVNCDTVFHVLVCAFFIKCIILHSQITLHICV